MRMPISRVRSVTLTSMMFITPMPPTSSEIAAIEPEQDGERVLRLGGRLEDRGHVADLEVRAVVPRLQERRDFVLRRVDQGDVVHRHRDGAQEALAEQAQATGRERHEHHVVLVLALRRGAAHRHQADHLEQHVVEHDVLADGIAARRKELVRDGLAEHHHRRVALHVRVEKNMPLPTGQLRATGNVAEVPVAWVW